MKSMSPSMERKGRKRKRSVNYDEVRQHVQVEVEEESLVNISNVSDLSEELALDDYKLTSDEDAVDDCISAATFTEQISTQGTFSHVRFVDTDSDVEPSPEKNLSSFACGVYRTTRQSYTGTPKMDGKVIM